jgi:hypothetical protein
MNLPSIGDKEMTISQSIILLTSALCFIIAIFEYIL